jgi:membrane-associated HD superfamily phosphohydrolase
MNKLSKAGMSRLGPVFKNGLIIAATYLLLAGMLVIGITPEQHYIQVGAPAPLDILASKDIIDTVSTEERRAAAAAAVEPSYKSIDFSVVGSVSSDMQSVFDTLLALRGSDWPAPDRITADELSALNASLPVDLSPDEYRALMTFDEDNLRHLAEDAIIDVRETLNSTLWKARRPRPSTGWPVRWPETAIRRSWCPSP